MEKKISCIGCNKTIPENILSISKKPESSEWVRSGYCSFKCFRDRHLNTRIEESIKTDKKVDNIPQSTISKTSGTSYPRKLKNITTWSTIIGFGLAVFSSMIIGFPKGFPGFIIAGLLGYLIGWIIYQITK